MRVRAFVIGPVTLLALWGAIHVYRNWDDTPRFPLPPDSPQCPHGMALVPSGNGSVTDADSRSKKMIDVPFASFCLDRNEVTVHDYEACVKARKCIAPLPYPPPHEQNVIKQDCNYGVPGRAWHPINCISYAEAEAYCRAVGKRLPTRYEWEYAAEGGGQHFLYPWGNNEPVDQLCWNRSFTSSPSTCVVRSFPPESFGLFDMGGNVSEYTVGMCTACMPDDSQASGGAWDDRKGQRADLVSVHRHSTWGGATVGVRCAQ
jgi:sulfatase modifying factor 1